ncbi:hypothetical protein O4328_43000 [Rhodococcus opacus]|uniref:Uncharacterized protein n=1 Tax=Rhodococcus opacus TaxID=37919 RepID=A0AAX3YUZ6_RHOOP|nr:hypothetical protein [Rhodococcus opacus]MCZ4590312.1 hypothetical protein [Rhodococcus opacus]WLF51580.1 hypothetical protein Q5707_39365 [Rhodococcus opacus]WLF52623.1 hypothetical protein Q5707_45630 [Rhodococcus opacus]
MSLTLHFEYPNQTPDLRPYEHFVKAALAPARAEDATATQVIFSGNFDRSVNDRLASPGRGFRSTHRGGAGLTVAKTMKSPRGVNCSDIIVNRALLAQDLTRVRVGGMSGSAPRFLAHEFLHAGIRRRGEPSTPGDSERTFWSTRAWRTLDEHRVERALCRTWPQDVDYLGDYADFGTDFVRGLRETPDVAQHVLGFFPALCEKLAYAIAAAGVTDPVAAIHRLPRHSVLRRDGLVPVALAKSLLAAPDALTLAPAEELVAHADRIRCALQSWLRDLGYTVEMFEGGMVGVYSV